jgi:lincosamide nucleotidyltransferase A/C/D/E
MPTGAKQALAVLDILDQAGIQAWVGGGWAVDALAGRQTRAHTDLDIVIDVDDEERLLASLSDHGFSMKIDWRPGRFLLTSQISDVDVHTVTFDDTGAGEQRTHDGKVWHYPADGFTTGTIDGREVPCLAAQVLRSFRQGSEPRDWDHHDLAVLDQL